MASGCGAANIARHFVLADFGYGTPFVATRCRLFGEHCYGESGSHYLLFLEEACDAMLKNADACGVGLVAVSRDVVESTNYIFKGGYNGHSSRGGVRVRVQWIGKQWSPSMFGNGGF